jgi:hypothetical protein
MSLYQGPDTSPNPPFIERFKDLLLKQITAENIDATGSKLLEALLPGIVADHVKRYEFAAKHFGDQNQPGENNIFMDLASGQGYGLDLLQNMLVGENMLVGVELNLESLEKAQSAHPLGENGLYIRGDVTNLPVADGEVDGITAFEIFEHIPQR